MDIDKWTAEKCGVFHRDTKNMQYWTKGSIRYEELWTIQDPRCREIVREHFKITTRPIRGTDWFSICYREIEIGVEGLSGTCKTIAESEIACIKAIYEAENE